MQGISADSEPNSPYATSPMRSGEEEILPAPSNENSGRNKSEDSRSKNWFVQVLTPQCILLQSGRVPNPGGALVSSGLSCEVYEMHSSVFSDTSQHMPRIHFEPTHFEPTCAVLILSIRYATHASNGSSTRHCWR